MIRGAVRWLLGIAFAAAGLLHLISPQPFVGIVPAWVPSPDAVVLGTGVAELLGAAGLLQPWSRELRQAAGVGLALYALCVWPANFKHAFAGIDVAGLPSSWWYHAPRLALQPAIMWWALFASGAIDWPMRRRG